MYLAVHIPMYLNCYVVISYIEENICSMHAVIAYVCFQQIGMKQVIYSVHSCMVSLVYIWLCSPQANYITIYKEK